MGSHPDISIRFAVPTFCLHSETLPAALEAIQKLTDHHDVMDGGLHHLENADVLLSYPANTLRQAGLGLMRAPPSGSRAGGENARKTCAGSEILRNVL